MEYLSVGGKTHHSIIPILQHSRNLPMADKIRFIYKAT